jgi:hypothetical protein
LYNVIQKEQLELCALLAIRFLIGNYCMRWCCNFKGLSKDGDQVKFAENLRGSPCYKDLSNETICSQIHLAGQYILILVCNEWCARLWQKIPLFRALLCAWGFKKCYYDIKTGTQNSLMSNPLKISPVVYSTWRVISWCTLYNEKQGGSRDGCGLLLVWYSGDRCWLIF